MKTIFSIFKTLFSSFFSATPAAEKTAQIIALILLYAIHLLPASFLSPTVSLILTGVLFAIVFFAQFATTDENIFKTAPNVLDGLVDLIQALPAQLESIKTMLAAQPSAADLNAGLGAVVDNVSSKLDTVNSALSALQPALNMAGAPEPSPDQPVPVRDNTSPGPLVETPEPVKS